MRNKEPNLAVATSVVLKLGSIQLLLYNEETRGFFSEWCLVGRGKGSWKDKEIEQKRSNFPLFPTGSYLPTIFFPDLNHTDFPPYL